MRGDVYPYPLKPGSVFLLLGLLTLIVYFNTLHASWQFDDKPNILDNPGLHIDDLSPNSLWQTFFAKAGRKAFYRPLPNLSFAINWYIGQANTFGYHITNTSIHILTAFILYLTICSLLQTPNLKAHYNQDDIAFISVFSAALWAINPIQTQAVTYIVQRMASMAAMFYLLSIFLYLKGRLSKQYPKRLMFWVGCLLTFIFASLSKENGAMLPASLVLIEIIFFQDLNSLKKFVKAHKILTVISGVIFMVVGIAYLKTIEYADRPYTMVERVLTEPRILLFYLSQLFYPLPSRLSVTHDIVISKSFISPWATFPAILAILSLIGLAVLQIWKRPLWSLAVLFFFLNHVIESSVIPLELIFEHRNYLPSLFLFLPIASGIKYLLNKYTNGNKFIQTSLIIFIVLTLIGWGCFTYIRNQVWRTETSLWQDAMQKAPNDARPVTNLAIQLAWGDNPSPLHYDVAMALFKRALQLNKARDFLDQELIANMGLIYYHRREYHNAIEYFEKALQMNPLFLKARYDLASSLIMLGQWEAASLHVDLILNNPKNYFKPEYFNLKGFILLWQQKPDSALKYFHKALQMKPKNRAAVLLNAGVALSLIGNHENAEFLFNMASRISAEDIRLHYALIENSVRSGNKLKAEKYVERMFARFSLETILDGIQFFTQNYRTAPMAPELIIPPVKKKILGLSKKIEMLSSLSTNEYVEHEIEQQQ